MEDKKMKKALLLLLGLLMTGIPLFAGGNRQTGSAKADEPVELVWYTGGLEPQTDMPVVLAEINKYLKEKINCTLKIIETDFGNFPQKMQMVIASQEPFDICFTSNWCNDFASNVNKNAFLELETLLPQYAPDLYRLIPEAGWRAASVNGHIYGIPNYQIWVRATAIVAETEWLTRYNMNIDQLKTWDGIETILSRIKKDNPNMYPFDEFVMVDVGSVLGVEELISAALPGAIRFGDNSLKAINQYELPQVMEIFKRLRSWNQKGYIRPDMAIIPNNYQDKLEGKAPIQIGGVMKPGYESEEAIKRGGREVKTAAFVDGMLTTNGITATMQGISRSSKNPEKALQFLNLLNTDKYLYNLLIWGIEGKHYRKAGTNFVEPIPNSGFGIACDWMYGNQFLAYFKPGQNETDWEETIKINKAAKISPAIGFAFNPASVQTEIATVSAVVTEYIRPLLCGAVDPEKTLPEFLGKLKDAGSEKLVAELQRQLDAWKASK
jgi:putative aldouronate transport system substrate-binding protein